MAKFWRTTYSFECRIINCDNRTKTKLWTVRTIRNGKYRQTNEIKRWKISARFAYTIQIHAMGRAQLSRWSNSFPQNFRISVSHANTSVRVFKIVATTCCGRIKNVAEYHHQETCTRGTSVDEAKRVCLAKFYGSNIILRGLEVSLTWIIKSNIGFSVPTRQNVFKGRISHTHTHTNTLARSLARLKFWATLLRHVEECYMSENERKSPINLRMQSHVYSALKR